MADIVLKNRDGSDVTYPGVNIIKVNTAGGGTKTFTAGEAEEKTVDPDFSGGDMEVTPDDGTLFSKVTVQKPETLTPANIAKNVEIAGVVGEFGGDPEEAEVELSMADGDQVIVPSSDDKMLSKVTVKKPDTLIPANIAEGVDIAGIVGTLAAGGSSTLNIKSGTVSGVQTGRYVSHGLGVVPDIFAMYAYNTSPIADRTYLIIAFGPNMDVPDKIIWAHANSSKLLMTYTGSANITTTGTSVVSEAGTDSIKVGSTVFNLDSSKTYKWIAIGGLT